MILDAYITRKTLLDENEKVRIANKAKKITSKTPIREVDISKVPIVKNKWWNKQPTIAGESMTTTQGKLSKIENFTFISRSKYEHSARNIAGDFLDTSKDPSKARLMMLNRSYSELTIPTRSADFNSGVEWRLSLRPDLY